METLPLEAEFDAAFVAHERFENIPARGGAFVEIGVCRRTYSRYSVVGRTAAQVGEGLLGGVAVEFRRRARHLVGRLGEDQAHVGPAHEKDRLGHRLNLVVVLVPAQIDVFADVVVGHRVVHAARFVASADRGVERVHQLVVGDAADLGAVIKKNAVKTGVAVGVGRVLVVIGFRMVDRVSVGCREGIDQILRRSHAARSEEPVGVEKVFQRAAFRVVGRPDDLGAVGIGPGERGGRIESVGSVLREFEIHHFGGVFRRILPALRIVLRIERRRGPLQVGHGLQRLHGEAVEAVPAHGALHRDVFGQPVAVGCGQVDQRRVAVFQDLFHALFVGGSFERAGVGVEDIDGFEHDGES